MLARSPKTEPAFFATIGDSSQAIRTAWHRQGRLRRQFHMATDVSGSPLTCQSGVNQARPSSPEISHAHIYVQRLWGRHPCSPVGFTFGPLESSGWLQRTPIGRFLHPTRLLQVLPVRRCQSEAMVASRGNSLSLLRSRLEQRGKAHWISFVRNGRRSHMRWRAFASAARGCAGSVCPARFGRVESSRTD